MKAFSRRYRQGLERFINVCHMAEIILSYPLSTCCYEQRFSSMKKVKTEFRSSTSLHVDGRSN